jgi:hypothetical protein
MGLQKLGYDDASARERGHFQFLAFGAGTKSIYIDCNSIDTLDVQLVWDGTLTAAVTVFASNSFIPNSEDMQTGTAIRAGAFTNITARVVKTADPAGAPGNQDIDCGETHQCFMRIDVARSAGSGNLDVYVSGKTYS